jgi:hypothetical protein
LRGISLFWPTISHTGMCVDKHTHDTCHTPGWTVVRSHFNKYQVNHLVSVCTSYSLYPNSRVLDQEWIKEKLCQNWHGFNEKLAWLYFHFLPRGRRQRMSGKGSTNRGGKTINIFLRPHHEARRLPVPSVSTKLSSLRSALNKRSSKNVLKHKIREVDKCVMMCDFSPRNRSLFTHTYLVFWVSSRVCGHITCTQNFFWVALYSLLGWNWLNPKVPKVCAEKERERGEKKETRTKNGCFTTRLLKILISLIFFSGLDRHL